jgi:hypothetical protein
MLQKQHPFFVVRGGRSQEPELNAPSPRGLKLAGVFESATKDLHDLEGTISTGRVSWF